MPPALPSALPSALSSATLHVEAPAAQPERPAAASVRRERTISLARLFLTCLKAGCLGFGGFLSLISVVEALVVKKMRLLKPEEMLDGISLASLLPGPQAVNVVAYVGYKLRGARGALVAGIAVVIPSFVLMILLASLYAQYGRLEIVEKLFHGFVPAVAAVILSVVWRMTKQAVRGAAEVVLVAVAALALLVTSLGLFGVPRSLQLLVTFAIVVACGLAGTRLLRGQGTPAAGPTRGAFPVAKVGAALALAGALVALLFLQPGSEPNGNARLATTFGGLSVMLFGGGYVFIPMIQHQVVDGYHWVGQQEFVDCIALSQVMPGPILVAATFIGYRVTGLAGALVSTIAIFTPPAILMVVASQTLEWFKRSPVAQAALRGIRCGVIGMILVAAFFVFRTALPAGLGDVRTLWPTALIFCAALLALLRFELDVVYVIPAGGLFGWLLYP